MRTIHLIKGLFPALVILFACNKKDDNLPAPAHTYYMDTKIDGKSVAYEDSIQGVLNKTSKDTSSFGNFTLIKQSSFFTGTDITGKIVNTTFSEYKKGCSCTSFLDSMFSAKNYTFKNSGQLEGIEITWFDGNQNWSSSYGNADQSGSSFSIVKHEYTGKQDYRYISSGNINCKLYNTDGDVKLMTGYFKLKTNTIY
ncbi:MAG: hypothetical protein ACJ75J_04875 [Cytophagaceae bacterium]